MRWICAVLVVLATVPSAASADMIVFRRGDAIWRMAPDGTAQTQVTAPGTLRYEWPSAADDGTILAPDTSGRLHRLAPSGAEIGVFATAAVGSTEESPAETPTHVRISPDGTKVAYDEAIDSDVSTLWSDFSGFPGQTLGQEGLVSPSWIGNSRLLLSRDISASDAGETFALYDLGGDNTAVDWFSDTGAPWATGFDPVASRDGSRVAVVEDDGAVSDGTPTRVALRLFNGTTFKCELPLEAADTADSASPSFSPDASSVAWAQSDGIHIASSDCTNERVVTLPGAWEPYWSPSPIPKSAAVAAPKLRLALKVRSHPRRLTLLKHGLRARVTLSAPARVRLSVRVAGTRRYLGTTTQTIANAGTTTVHVRLTTVPQRRLLVRLTAAGQSATALVRPS